MRLTIVPAFRDEVCRFVDDLHRHHRRPLGYIVASAVADEDGRVVGVYTLARPTAKGLQDGWTCEVNRTCTDGTKNANSALYGAAWRVARALGYRRCVTYTEEGESGASLRAAGWHPVAELKPRRGWDAPSRRRDNAASRPGVPRTRWEVLAEPAPWIERPRVPAPPVLEPAPVVELDLIAAAIAAAPDEATIDALYDGHVAEWRDEHTAAVLARLAELGQGAAA